MLRIAFNALISLHSRSAMLKRLGTPDIYTPARISPSNYFRFLRGPEYTTVKGVEFVIPLDSLTGQFSQQLTFDEVPDEGTFRINLGGNSTASDLNFDSPANTIQAAVQLLPGLSGTTVTGNFTSGFIFLLSGLSSPIVAGQVVASSLEKTNVEVVPTWTLTQTPWTKKILKGDRITDGSHLWTVDEIIDLHDLGAIVMGYRIRCD